MPKTYPPVFAEIVNYLIPRKDMVQLPVWRSDPVVPTLRPGITSRVRREPFQEHGGSESLSQAIPSAGVGTAFSRRALLALAGMGGRVYIGSLTEDYEIACDCTGGV